MLREIREVLRLLMMSGKPRQQHKAKHSRRLLVLFWTEKTQPLTVINCTVAAAGQWCAETEKKALQLCLKNIVVPHLLSCPEPDPEELSAFTKPYGAVKLLVSFKMTDTRDWPDWQSYIQNFVQKFSMANGLIGVHLKFNLEDQTSLHERRGKLKRAVALEDHLRVTMDVSSSGPPPVWVKKGCWCHGGHPVAGVKLPLSIPPQVMHQGLFGELSVQFVTLWKPCVLLYPNLPTELKDIQVLMYSPSNIPVPCPSGFFQTLPSALDNQKMGLERLNCSSLKDLVYSGSAVYTEAKNIWKDPDQDSSHLPHQQSLLLFLFLQHNDPFISKVPDLIAAEWLIERHLEEILNNNKQAVTAAVEKELCDSLKAYNLRKKHHDKLLSASEVILSSTVHIVSCSSNMDFRNACFKCMKVQDTNELSASLRASLWETTSWRFVAKTGCSLIQEQTERNDATKTEI